MMNDRAGSDESHHPSGVMPALVVGIHVFLAGAQPKDVDGLDKPGHDSE